MFDKIVAMVPEQWQDLVEILILPISWIPVMQQSLQNFFFDSSSWWIAGGKVIFFLFPVLLGISAVWCTQLSIYTLPFRSQRLNFISMILLAWWDAARMVVLYLVGLFRVVVVMMGWVFTLMRLALRLMIETFCQVLFLPFAATGRMSRSYFQPGIPWIGFILLVFWCLLEAMIFTYVLSPTVSEVLADLVGAEAHRFTWPALYMFLFLLILGSFACLQTLLDTMKKREFKFLVQMIVVELFVMFFEVMFFYRELVDAITPWIAQQTGERFRMGITFTVSLAVFAWIGVRGMTWFLFGQFGTLPLLAIISRQPMVQPEGRVVAVAQAEAPNWWSAPMEDFKREIGWLHEKSNELLEYLALPTFHVIAAALNFIIILVASRPLFVLPFKSLKEAMMTRQVFPEMPLSLKRVNP